MHRLILKTHVSPGDVVMLTAAVQDVKRSHPEELETDARTAADQLWEKIRDINPA